MLVSLQGRLVFVMRPTNVKIRHPLHESIFDDSTDQVAIYCLPCMDKDELVFKCVDLKCHCELRARPSSHSTEFNFELYYNASLHQCIDYYDVFYTMLSMGPAKDFKVHGGLNTIL